MWGGVESKAGRRYWGEGQERGRSIEGEKKR